MPRAVIDLSRNLPARATRLTGGALERVFGGGLPCVNEGMACGFLLTCCAGAVCRGGTAFGIPVKRCEAA